MLHNSKTDFSVLYKATRIIKTVSTRSARPHLFNDTPLGGGDIRTLLDHRCVPNFSYFKITEFGKFLLTTDSKTDTDGSYFRNQCSIFTSENNR